jgi:hypothetical protein
MRNCPVGGPVAGHVQLAHGGARGNGHLVYVEARELEIDRRPVIRVHHEGDLEPAGLAGCVEDALTEILQ